jgi:hypothetical protein
MKSHRSVHSMSGDRQIACKPHPSVGSECKSQVAGHPTG